MVYDNILLAGDAAGLVSPLHGGGIDTACISGKIAVQYIINNVVAYSYEDMIDAIIGQKLKSDKMLFELWRTLDYNVFESIVKNIISNGIIKITFSDLFTGNSNS